MLYASLLQSQARGRLSAHELLHFVTISFLISKPLVAVTPYKNVSKFNRMVRI